MSYLTAASIASLFELRFRIFAGSVSEISQELLDKNLNTLSQSIFEHFNWDDSNPHRMLIVDAIQLRNKLLHCEFSRLRNKLNTHKPATREGGVVKASVDMNLSNDEFKQFFKDLIAGKNVGQQKISNTTTKRRNAVYGWLYECWEAGIFEECASIFEKAITTLDSIPRDNSAAKE